MKMYKNHQKKAFLLCLVVFIISLGIDYYFNVINISESLMQNFITFLSIVLGFYTASISALYGSKYLGKIYDTIDEKKPSNLLIHTLQSYFKASIYCGLITLCGLFVISILSKVDFGAFAINSFIKAIVVTAIFLNILFMSFITRILLTSLLVEGKEISSENKNKH